LKEEYSRTADHISSRWTSRNLLSEVRLNAENSLEVISNADMEADARAGLEAASKHAGGEREVITQGVTASDLSFQLTSTQLEIVGHTVEQPTPSFSSGMKSRASEPLPVKTCPLFP
jgi:hypothetical protein